MSDNTIKAYVTDVDMFFRETELQEFEVTELDYLAATWLNARRRQVAPKTLTRRITSMRALAKALGIVVLKEYNAPTPAKSMPHPLPGLADDLEKLVRFCKSDHQQVLIALTGYCGLRVGEALATGPNEFDLHNMTLTVRGKGDKTRIVPVSERAWEILCGPVVEAKLSGASTIVQMTDRHAREIITRLGHRAGIARPIASHDLRATFATVAFNTSRNIRAVQELLGHASVEQTALYTGVRMDQMRAAANFHQR